MMSLMVVVKVRRYYDMIVNYMPMELRGDYMNTYIYICVFCKQAISFGSVSRYKLQYKNYEIDWYRYTNIYLSTHTDKLNLFVCFINIYL